VPQTVKPPSANQPPAQPVAAKAAEPEIQKENPEIVPAAEPLPENNINPVAPASSGTASVQGGTEP